MVYFPREVWRIIFEFDRTFKEIYDRVMMELELTWFIVKYLDLEFDFSDIWENDDDIDWGI